MTKVESGDTTPVNVPPIGSTEEASQVGYKKIGQAAKDQIKVSEGVTPSSVTAECDKPTLAAPDAALTSDASLQQAVETLKANPWFLPSFLSAFNAIMYELLQTQKQIQFNESNMELYVRQKLYDLAQTNAELSKQITDNQAFEKLVQAVAAFATAALTAYNLVETTKNMGEATSKVENDIKNQRSQLDKAKFAELNKDPETKAKIGVIDEPINPSADQIAKREKALSEVVDKNKDYQYKSDEVKREQKKLDELEGSKETKIYEKERMLSTLSQMKGEALKQAVQAVSGVLTAQITFERGRMEESKGLNEGAIQALNKFSETTTKARDDAKGNFDKFADFMNRIIESVATAHRLGRG